jgi:hypothetical protein
MYIHIMYCIAIIKCEDRLFIGRVVMGTLLEVEFSVCTFTVYFVAQRAVGFLVYIDIQKW